MNYTLKAAQVQRFHFASSARLQVQSGVAWLTSNLHHEDIFLHAGESYELSANEDLVLENASSVFPLYLQAARRPVARTSWRNLLGLLDQLGPKMRSYSPSR